MGELQAGTGARDQTRQEHEIAIGAERDRGPQLLAAVSVDVGVPICSLLWIALACRATREIDVIREGLPTILPESHGRR